MKGTSFSETSRSIFFARLGVRLSGQGAWARLRVVALTIGTTVLSLGLVILVLILGLAGDRQTRAEQIRPTLATTGDNGRLLISQDGFVEIDDRSTLVVSIWPLDPAAPLPPGVEAWPAPGHAVVSPAVASQLKEHPGLFGPLAGTIALGGLETPTERRVYLRPSTEAFDRGSMTPATGFGGNLTDGWWGLGVLDAAPRWQAIALPLIAVAFPGVMSLALGAGLDQDRRAKRRRLLTVSGASRRLQWGIDVSEAWPAAAAGTLIAGTATAVLLLRDLSLPWLETTLVARQVQDHTAPLVGALIGGHVLALLVVLVVSRALTRSGGRMRSPRIGQPLPVTRAIISLAVGAATIVLPTQTQSGPIRTVIYLVGTVVFALTLPAMLAILLSMAGSLIANLGLRTGSVGALLGGRRLEVFPARTARLCLGIAGSILILGQVQLWATQLGQQYTQSLAARAEFGTTVLRAEHTTYGQGVANFLSRIDDSTLPLWLWMKPQDAGPPVVTIGAPCTTLERLQLPCATTTVPALTAANASAQINAITRTNGITDTFDVQPLPDFDADQLKDSEAALILVSASDQDDLPLDELQKLAYQTTPGGLQFEAPGQGWLVQGVNLKIRGNWTILWGLLGILSILAASAIAIAADLTASARDVAPLATLASRRRWLTTLSLWRLALPITLAGIAGAASYYLLPSGVRNGEVFMTPSLTFAAAAVIASTATAAVLTLYAKTALQRASEHWRPGDGDHSSI